MSFGLAWVIALFLELAIFSDTISDKIKRDHAVLPKIERRRQHIFDPEANSPAVRHWHVGQCDERNLHVPFGQNDKVALDEDSSSTGSSMFLNDFVFGGVREVNHASVAMFGHGSNQRIGRIKRMFRWAVENELIPVTISQALETVRGLGQGRQGGRGSRGPHGSEEAFRQSG
jgi:hypothetical protein